MKTKFNLLAYSCMALFAGILAIGTARGDDGPRLETPRASVPLGSGWKFSFGEAAPQVTGKDFDDTTWESVDVPHTWNRVGYYENSLVSHINRPGNIDSRQGVAWYRLRFTAPAAAEGRRSWLEFDAASRTAEVWLNGIPLGEHRGGFTRFRFDVTDVLRPGEPNFLAVKTDNTKPTADSSTADVFPIAGDFFVHGGLYRPVRLVFTDPVHVDMLDFGGPGVYATTKILTDEVAEISVRSRVRNDSDQGREIELSTMLLDGEGQVVARAQEELSLSPGSGMEKTQVLQVRRPTLWQGTENPYLYTLRVELRAAESKLLDRLDQRYGLREMQIDANRGFILNGKPLRLHGVAYHQDREGKGWATSPSDVEEDVEIMREMGVNTIRLAHYPHGQPVHDLADRYGLMLWDEIPVVTSWDYGSEHEKINKALAANAKLQLTELVRQNFNHPSVAVWGIANEVDFGVVLPAFLGAPASDTTDPMPLLQELNALAKKEDPSRPTTLANCCEARPGLVDIEIPAIASVVDTDGANRYFGWYYGKPEDLGPHLDTLRGVRPRQPLAVSEYGAGAAVSLHTDDPLGGPVDATGHDQPEEYMSLVHEVSWPQMASKPWLWASWVWNGFDFATSIRAEGDSRDINTKGLVTYDRQIKKDSYFFYKANWSSAPTVHITGRRYRERAYPTTDIRVYSNAPETELFVNGHSQGARSDCQDRVCVWPAISLQAGANRIEALGAFPSGQETDAVEWSLDGALDQAYHIDTGALIAAQSTAAQFGSDAFFTGGQASTVDKPGGWGKPAEKAPISGTQDRDLAATYREGNFIYRLPVRNGEYNVRLTFVEPSRGPGERQFNVLANNAPLLERFDVAAEGGLRAAVTREFKVAATDGVIELEFGPVHGDAVVSAIMVDPVGR